MIKSELVTTRFGTEADKNFIYATWLRGLYYGESWFSEIPKQIFMENYHTAISNILRSPNTVVKVACLKDDPEVILAYIILKPVDNAIIWAFCKKAWRGIGIVKELTPENVSVVTHLTKTGLLIARKKGLTFNPFISI